MRALALFNLVILSACSQPPATDELPTPPAAEPVAITEAAPMQADASPTPKSTESCFLDWGEEEFIAFRINLEDGAPTRAIRYDVFETVCFGSSEPRVYDHTVTDIGATDIPSWALEAASADACAAMDAELVDATDVATLDCLQLGHFPDGSRVVCDIEWGNESWFGARALVKDDAIVEGTRYTVMRDACASYNRGSVYQKTETPIAAGTPFSELAPISLDGFRYEACETLDYELMRSAPLVDPSKPVSCPDNLPD
ncbi:MAG: hypothetical protein AAFR74_05075 [Pseudomonadota bacterium]